MVEVRENREWGENILVLALLLLLAGCVQTAPPHVKWGDEVVVDYAVFANDSGHWTLLFTNNVTVFNTYKHGVFSAERTFKVGDKRLPAFVNRALVDMKEGESKTFYLSPKDAFGEVEKVEEVRRVVRLHQFLNLSNVELMFYLHTKSVKQGQRVRWKGLPARVVATYDNGAQLQLLLENYTTVFAGCKRHFTLLNDTFVGECVINNNTVMTDKGVREVLNESGNTLWINADAFYKGKAVVLVVHVLKVRK